MTDGLLIDRFAPQPLIMSTVKGREELRPLAQEAARRLEAVLDALASG